MTQRENLPAYAGLDAGIAVLFFGLFLVFWAGISPNATVNVSMILVSIAPLLLAACFVGLAVKEVVSAILHRDLQ
jgi:hypothetical protein